MKTVTVNPLDPKRYTIELKEAFSLGHVVACAQRPLNGLNTWEGVTLGNGIYFASGPLESFKRNWEFLDATIVQIQTNEDVLKEIETICQEEGMELSELLQDNTIEELARSLDFLYIS